MHYLYTEAIIFRRLRRNTKKKISLPALKKSMQISFQIERNSKMLTEYSVERNKTIPNPFIHSLASLVVLDRRSMEVTWSAIFMVYSLAQFDIPSSSIGTGEASHPFAPSRGENLATRRNEVVWILGRPFFRGTSHCFWWSSDSNTVGILQSRSAFFPAGVFAILVLIPHKASLCRL